MRRGAVDNWGVLQTRLIQIYMRTICLKFDFCTSKYFETDFFFFDDLQLYKY